MPKGGGEMKVDNKCVNKHARTVIEFVLAFNLIVFNKTNKVLGLKKQAFFLTTEQVLDSFIT